jgi:cell division transport system ATP-binding protein
MATHEAGFVNEMQRRVIELRGGALIRDDRHGGYGDTSALPSLAPQEEKGAAATAALTAVLQLQREIAAQPAPLPVPSPQPQAAPEPAPAEDPAPTDEVSPGTRPIQIAAPDVDLGQLGLANLGDKLGLADDEDEVGPTT